MVGLHGLGERVYDHQLTVYIELLLEGKDMSAILSPLIIILNLAIYVARMPAVVHPGAKLFTSSRVHFIKISYLQPSV